MIASERIAALADAVVEQGLDEHTIARLREANPELHFTYCTDDDVGADTKPVAERSGFNVYLVGGTSGHCLNMTNDNEIATGLVFAEVIEDDA